MAEAGDDPANPEQTPQVRIAAYITGDHPRAPGPPPGAAGRPMRDRNRGAVNTGPPMPPWGSARVLDSLVRRLLVENPFDLGHLIEEKTQPKPCDSPDFEVTASRRPQVFGDGGMPVGPGSLDAQMCTLSLPATPPR